MGRHIGFVVLSQKVYTKIVILLCLILILGSAGIAQMVFAIPEYLDNGLNPIPYSPAPPKNLNKINSTVDVTYENGNRIYSSDDGWRSVSPTPLSTGETVPSKLNVYGACKSVFETSNGNTVLNNIIRLSYDSLGNTKTSMLLMYPQIKDIIPPSAQINSAVIISTQSELNGQSLSVEAYEIQSSWDPRTFTGQIPTLSTQPIGTGTFDEMSPDINNRTIDVTQTVNSWFAGATSQWGLYIVTNTQISNDYLYPPKLYIDYTMPVGSYSTDTVSGGTWYSDSICPGLWLPRRATYINKLGILNNRVTTGILAATTMDPPFGYDNQSFRWVVTGKPTNSNINYQAGYFNIKSESVSFFNNVIWNVPSINTLPFASGQIDFPDIQLRPPMSGGSGTIIGWPPPPGGPRDTMPPESPDEVIICEPYWEYVIPPPTIEPPQIPDPPDTVATPPTLPPTAKNVPTTSLNEYTWTNMKNQWISFRSTTQDYYDINKLQVGGSNWPSQFLKIENNVRIAPTGFTDVAWAPKLGDIYQDLTTLNSNQIVPNQTIPVVEPGWRLGNNVVAIIMIWPFIENVQEDGLCINCDNLPTNPPRKPNSDDEVDAYDVKLPYPEYIQSNNIGIGNSESSLEKDLNIGPYHTLNPISGSIEHINKDYSIPIHGNLNLEFNRSYSTANKCNGVLGLGWATNIDEKINYLSEGYLSYQSSSGETYLLTPNRDENSVITSYACPPQLDVKTTLTIDGEQTYVTLADKSGSLKKIFDNKGFIRYIRSDTGGEIEFYRNTQNQVIKLIDTYSGRYLEFIYDTYGRLVGVFAPETRNWVYSYDNNDMLHSATNPIGGIWYYEYSSNILSKITNPRGYDVDFSYDSMGRASTILQEGSTNPENIYYDSEYRSVKVIKPAGEVNYSLFSQAGQLVAQVEGNGGWSLYKYNPIRMEDISAMYNQNGDYAVAIKYDQYGRISKEFDAIGNYREYTYTTNSKIATYKDCEGKTTTITWNQDGSVPTKITDALGRETLYEYDSNKNLIKMKTPYKNSDPAETVFEYDVNGYLSKVTNPLGKTTEYTYNNCGDLTSVKDALGKIITYTLNKMSVVTKLTGPLPDNREAIYTYDPCMNLTSFTNFRGTTTSFEYDNRNFKTKATDGLNRNCYYTYDDTGKLLKVKDQKNNETILEYDAIGRLKKTTDQENKYCEVLYDNLGRVTGYKNKNGDESNVVYDELYRCKEKTSAQGATTKYEYDKEGHVTKVTDPNNRSTYFEYDACYQLTKVTDNAGKYSTVEYWPSGQIKKSTDPLNHIAEYDYNKLGLPVSVKDNEAHETTMLYDDLGRCIRVTNALNGYKSFEYNMYGLLTKSTNELGKFTTYEYDENGNQTKQTTSLGKEYRWTYDAIDRVKKTITPMGFEYEKTYDDVGNVIEIKDPLQHLESFEYTSTYNLSKYIDQINNQTSYNYNDANDLTKTTLPKGTFQEYTYDKEGNVKTVIDPLGNTATYNYNIGGELTERQLPKIGGGTTSFTYTYDTVGRRTTFTDEASKSTTCTYNDIGLVTQLSHPNSKTISSTYDTLNRLTGVTFGGGETFSYSYDALGRTIGATDQHGTKSISYDAASRVTSSTDPFGDQTSLSYDDDDRVTSVTTPLGATSTTYDNDSRPTQINLASGGQINNTFDNAARLTHSDLPNGVDLDFTYNNANNPTNKTYSLPDPFFNNGPKVQTSKPKDPDSLFVTIGKQAQSLYNKLGPNPTFGDICTLLLDQKYYGTLRTLPVIVASFSYTYDANKNISQRSYPNGIQNFTYDNYDRLTQATASEGTYTYTYDVRNNRSTMRFVNYNQTVDQTTTYTYSIDDRLTSYTVVNNLNQQTIRTVNYTYDDAGNTLTKAVTEGGTTLTTTYTYYDDNRLKTTTLPSSEVITYTYHADGTRATKTNNTEWIRYHYSGGLVKEVHCDKNNHSTILFTIHYQPGRIIYQPNQGNNVYYYTASDCSGTIYKLLDDQGQIVASYNYDPFGVLIENTNPSIYMPIGYSGTYRDTETGLLYAQSRYYDPSVGRFTTKDSYRGELVSQISQNRYIYCSQNPVSYGDPSGFAPIEGDDINDITSIESDHNKKQVADLDQINNTKSTARVDPNTTPVPDGTVIKTGTNTFTIKIAGHTIGVTISSDGSTITFTSDGTTIGDAIADGFNDALKDKDLNKIITTEITKYGSAYFESNLRDFASKMQDFYTKYYEEYRGMNGSECDNYPQKFFFSAMYGYATACVMTNSIDVDGKLLDALVDSALKNYNNLTGENIKPFDFFMIQGFSVASCYANFNPSGTMCLGYGLSFTKSSLNNGYDSQMGFLDIVSVQSNMWLATSAMGQFNGNANNNKLDVEKLNRVAVETIEFAVSSIADIILDALNVSWISVCASYCEYIKNVINIVFSNSEYSNNIENSCGFTQQMENNLITNKHINGGVNLNQSLFTSVMVSSMYLNYNIQKRLKGTKNSSIIMFGDIIKGVDNYLTLYLTSKECEDTDSDLVQDNCMYVIKNAFGSKANFFTYKTYREWRKLRYVKKVP